MTARSIAPSLDRLHAAERAHGRRLLWTSAIAVLLSLVSFVTLPAPDRSATSRARRWGFLGPERIVPVIEVPDRTSLPLELWVDAGDAIEAPEAPEGSSGEAGDEPRAPGGRDTPRPPGGEGITARSLLRASLPTVRSEELVIDVLVKPEYPKEAQARGLEAIVELEAFVDVDGTVREIRLLSNTGDPTFAAAASRAVERCRFRPYREDGTPTPVFAHFRFNFRLI